MSDVQLHLMNDNEVHGMDVETALMSVFGMTNEAAEVYTYDAHTQGHSIIFTGDEQEAIRKGGELAMLGINTELTLVGGELFGN